MENQRLWIRHETRPAESRAPIVPDDARLLIDSGFEITIEESPQRVFPLSDYVDAGCAVAAAGDWITAPSGIYILGLKELPDSPPALAHRHIFFGHAYKGQAGARDLLRRFVKGGGKLLDLEHLVDDDGRRVAAFGYWAGYVGAALTVLHYRGLLKAPLAPLDKDELDEALRGCRSGSLPRALVIGALGRGGRGAQAALSLAGVEPTCWDVAETALPDRRALLEHDVLINTVLASAPIDPFLTDAQVQDPSRRLTLICDVSCDVASRFNALPIYDRVTTWQRPVQALHDAPPLEIIAIDNLPSLLPWEASVAFSAELRPHLMRLGDTPVWRRCQDYFQQATHHYQVNSEDANV